MRIWHVLLLAVAALALTGCPKKIETKPDASAATGVTDSGATTGAVPNSDVQNGSNMSADQAALQALQQTGMVIYFDYDKAEIKSDFVPVLAAHAKYLNADANRKVRLEGNTDERGSREYNIGLGERRAQAVRRALMLQGVADSQITTISYGAERPAVEGHDETAYSKNRRVEISYGK